MTEFVPRFFLPPEKIRNWRHGATRVSGRNVAALRMWRQIPGWGGRAHGGGGGQGKKHADCIEESTMNCWRAKSGPVTVSG